VVFRRTPSIFWLMGAWLLNTRLSHSQAWGSPQGYRISFRRSHRMQRSLFSNYVPPNVPIRRLLRTNASATIYQTTASTNSGQVSCQRCGGPMRFQIRRFTFFGTLLLRVVTSCHRGRFHSPGSHDQPGDYARTSRTRMNGLEQHPPEGPALDQVYFLPEVDGFP